MIEKFALAPQLPNDFKEWLANNLTKLFESELDRNLHFIILKAEGLSPDLEELFERAGFKKIHKKLILCDFYVYSYRNDQMLFRA